MDKYDVIIIGAGPGGIFGAYELIEKNPDCKIAVFEAGHELAKRKCPIDGKKVKSCISCKSRSRHGCAFRYDGWKGKSYKRSFR